MTAKHIQHSNRNKSLTKESCINTNGEKSEENKYSKTLKLLTEYKRNYSERSGCV